MELTRTWRKSSFSGADSGNCVETASQPGTVAVRDSADPSGPMLAIRPTDWAAFTRRLRDR
jgi:hypothetical protein